MFSTPWEEESWRVAHRVARDRTRDGPKKRKLSRGRQKLVLKFLPLARAWAKPFKREWWWSRDEFDSAAYLALVEAAAAFDPIRGVTFGVFAQARIRGAMLDLVSHLRHTYQTGGGPDHRLHRLGLENERPWRTMLATPDEPVGSKIEAEEFAERWIDKLPPRHATACREIYVKGKTQQEAAEVLGCSKSKMSVLHKEAIDLIRESWRTRIEGLDRRRRPRED